MNKIIIGFLLLINSAFAVAEVDPFEDINRISYKVNDLVDGVLLEPISRLYKESVPDIAQNSVHNFFGNLRDVSTLANQILQFKLEESAVTFGRILINSTVGLMGVLDVARDVGITTDSEDFGQTLAVWGVGDGPYVVLPLLGQSTSRDVFGMYFDLTSDANLINKMHDIGFVSVSTMNIINKRAELLPATDLLNQSDDSYIALRSSYLQNRKFDIYDGDLPISDDDF
jgi:phospholipid-binding lipoprotein MlaA